MKPSVSRVLQNAHAISQTIITMDMHPTGSTSLRVGDHASPDLDHTETCLQFILLGAPEQENTQLGWIWLR